MRLSEPQAGLTFTRAPCFSLSAWWVLLYLATQTSDRVSLKARFLLATHHLASLASSVPPSQLGLGQTTPSECQLSGQKIKTDMNLKSKRNMSERMVFPQLLHYPLTYPAAAQCRMSPWQQTPGQAWVQSMRPPQTLLRPAVPKRDGLEAPGGVVGRSKHDPATALAAQPGRSPRILVARKAQRQGAHRYAALGLCTLATTGAALQRVRAEASTVAGAHATP